MRMAWVRREPPRHEWWNPPPSGGGKAHDEAGAEHPRRLAAHAIFNADRAAVRFDDLLGDRQAKPGILAEALFRPVGIETLEDFIERFRRIPGPSSSTRISTSPRTLRQVIRTVPPAGENERALSIRLLTTWPILESWPAILNSDSGPSNVSVTLTSSVRTSFAALTSASSSFAKSMGAAS